MKINEHVIWQAMTQLTLRCLKYIKKIFSLHAIWYTFYRKRAKSLEKFFSSYENANWSILLKYREINGQIHSLTKIKTSYIVVFVNDTNCRFVDYKHRKSGHCTFILVQLWAILCQCPKRFMIFDIESKH